LTEKDRIAEGYAGMVSASMNGLKVILYYTGYKMIDSALFDCLFVVNQSSG